MPGEANATVVTARAGSPDIQRRRKEQARQAFRLWGGVTLVGVAVLGGLTVWHLRRRLRLLHDRADPPRQVEWPESDGAEGENTP